LNADTVNGEIVSSMNSMLLLSSSCQAVIEDEIKEVSSDWYKKLDQELGAAENIVLEWRQSGYLYFQTDVLKKIISVGQTIGGLNTSITHLFDEINKNGLTPTNKATLIAQFNQAKTSIKGLDGTIDGYLERLRDFQKQMEGPHSQMTQTIADVQAEESKIKSEISAINTHIKALQHQISVDRKAISKAKAARKRGIIETIFGCVFAPLTGGASLILAGIGASSISDAEHEIQSMESSISNYQGQIVSEQHSLNEDEKIVATLNALNMSTKIVLDDIDSLDLAMTSLRTTWQTFVQELDDVISKIQTASSAQEVVLQQAWWNAAVLAWQNIETSTKTLLDRQTDTNHVRIG